MAKKDQKTFKNTRSITVHVRKNHLFPRCTITSENFDKKRVSCTSVDVFDKKIKAIGATNEGTFIRFATPVTVIMDSDKNIRVK